MSVPRRVYPESKLEPPTVEQEFTYHTEGFLEDLRKIRCSKEEFLEGLRAALGELEVEIQACKETL